MLDTYHYIPDSFQGVEQDFDYEIVYFDLRDYCTQTVQHVPHV